MGRGAARYVDVGVVNLETRLGPLFEYLRYRSGACEDDGGRPDDDEETLDVVASAATDALEAARGGSHDAKELLMDALFFAWVSSVPSVAVPCDPFSARSKWRLSTKQFVKAATSAGLRRELRKKLRATPNHVYPRLAAELSEHIALDSSEEAVAIDVEESEREVARESASDSRRRDERDERRRRLDAFSRAGDASKEGLDFVRRCEASGRRRNASIAGGVLLCSERFRGARDATRRDATDDDRATVDRELIAALNRVGGDAKAPASRDVDAFASEVTRCLASSPEVTVSRLVRTAATNASQVPFLILAFEKQPGIAKTRLGPDQPPLLLAEIARTFRNPPAELRGARELEGLRRFTTALLRAGGSRHPDDAWSFGERLASPRRSQLDPREVLLIIVIPALRDSASEQRSPLLEYEILRILNALLTDTDDDRDDVSLSPEGVQLLRATYPGGVLFGLAASVDAGIGSPAKTRDLASGLLRSCVEALRVTLSTSGRESQSVIMSLAHADAAAATRISWRTRIVMEPLMCEIRKLAPDPHRSVPRGELVGEGASAAAFSDVLALCASRHLDAVEVMKQLQGHQEPRKELRHRIKCIQNAAESPSLLRCALLEACASTLPGLTAKEFTVVLLGILPRVLSFASGDERMSAIPSQALVMDFLTRVLLTQAAAEGNSRETESLSRHVTNAAVHDSSWVKPLTTKDQSHVVAVAGALHRLNCLKTALEVLSHASETTQAILLNAILKLIGDLCESTRAMALEIEKMFSSFPDGDAKQQVLAACSADLSTEL